MNYRQLHRLCRRRLRDLGLHPPMELGSLVQALGDARGKPIELVGADLSAGEAFGLLSGDDLRDVIFFDRSAPPVHRMHIVCHELGHIILDHPRHAVEPARPAGGPAAKPSPGEFEEILPEMVALVLGEEQAPRPSGRPAMSGSVYDDITEWEAETVGTILMGWIDHSSPGGGSERVDHGQNARDIGVPGGLAMKEIRLLVVVALAVGWVLHRLWRGSATPGSWSLTVLLLAAALSGALVELTGDGGPLAGVHPAAALFLVNLPIVAAVLALRLFRHHVNGDPLSGPGVRRSVCTAAYFAVAMAVLLGVVWWTGAPVDHTAPSLRFSALGTFFLVLGGYFTFMLLGAAVWAGRTGLRAGGPLGAGMVLLAVGTGVEGLNAGMTFVLDAVAFLGGPRFEVLPAFTSVRPGLGAPFGAAGRREVEGVAPATGGEADLSRPRAVVDHPGIGVPPVSAARVAG